MAFFLLFAVWQTTYANKSSGFSVMEGIGWAVFGERYVIRWIYRAAQNFLTVMLTPSAKEVL
jgi:hypothetical protein